MYRNFGNYFSTLKPSSADCCYALKHLMQFQAPVSSNFAAACPGPHTTLSPLDDLSLNKAQGSFGRDEDHNGVGSSDDRRLRIFSASAR